MSKSKALELSVDRREDQGTSASRRLRREGKVPAVIYGHGSEGTALTLSAEELGRLTHHAGLISFTIDGKDKATGIVKEVQHHPITGAVLHVDFQEVKADQIITTTALIEPHGEPAGASHGGVLEQFMHELEIRCRPMDIIEALTVEVSDMELDDIMTVADLKLPEGVETTADPEQTVFQVREPKVMEEGEEGAEAEEGVEGEGVEGGAEDAGTEEASE